eukprot:766204-Hanusia_phi.AAC.3
MSSPLLVVVSPRPRDEASSLLSPPPVPLSLPALQALFHLPQEIAARRLGMSVSSLKLACRKLGIRRWPYSRWALPPSQAPAPSAANEASELSNKDIPRSAVSSDSSWLPPEGLPSGASAATSSHEQQRPRLAADAGGEAGAEDEEVAPGSGSDRWSSSWRPYDAKDREWLEWYEECELEGEDV